MVARNAQLRQSRQFFLPPNLRQLHPGEIWILGTHVPGGECDNIDLIRMRLQHRQSAVRQLIIISMRAD